MKTDKKKRQGRKNRLAKKKQTAAFRFEKNLTTLILSIIMILALTGLAKISISNAIKVQNTIQASLQRQTQKLDQKVADLEKDILDLSRPDRIRRYARQNLEMVEYKPDANVLKLD